MLEKQAGLLLAELDLAEWTIKKRPDTFEQAKGIRTALDGLCAFLQELILARDNDLTGMTRNDSVGKNIELLREFYNIPPDFFPIALGKAASPGTLH
ncbi:hypothetical protein GTO89_07740 [Heliobacterium gestii]|uniref:Uncharacterized protein n=1 Tax=Heliomicrobium gestii TaxID=2699 RepID=A0A845L861_HELGE|nr:hypothetical protein [Heliomicrobium gestii]MBM7866280.1 hypothetical protein [Heliomicrobium gestii]MZP42927.1 hypothetical protein [Heliomicrobium gestii]